MYIDHYKDKLLEQIKELKREVALYRSEDPIAAIQDAYDRKIRGLDAKAQKYYRNWMNAVDKNRLLKDENSSLRNERATLKSASKKLRTQNDRLKAEVDRLRGLNRQVIGQRDEYAGENKEKDEQIEALKDEIRRLKAQADHDGSTNGIPTSQTPRGKEKRIPNTRVRTGKKKGGQKGHEKHSLGPHPDEEVTETMEHPLDCCPACGGELAPMDDAVEKDETDYEVRIIKRRHRFPKYRCRNCGKEVRANIPKNLKEKNQYGANIQAMLLALVDLGFVSINRSRRISTGMLGGQLGISEGYVGKVQKKASRMLKDFQEEVREFCLAQEILYWDDTVIFMNTTRACFRFYGNEKVAYYRAHSSKGATGIEEDGILANLTGKTTLMHDHFKYNYRKEFLFRNIECVQHLERELERVFRDSGHKWAKEMKDLIASMIHKRKRYMSVGRRSFTDEDTGLFEREMERILVKGWKVCKEDKDRYYHTDEKNCLRKFEEYRENYFAWVYDFSLPTTNNLSEASLRMTKTKQKVSGQFLKEETAREFAAVRTYTETCRRNGIDEYGALRRLMAGNPYSLGEILAGKV